MPPRRNTAKAKAAARAAQAQPSKAATAQKAPIVEQKKIPPGSAVGIDFGTSTITLAAYKSDTFDIIVNANGERYTPVRIGYSQDELVLGSPANAIAIRSPANTIQYITKFLGRTFESLTDDEKKSVDCQLAATEDGLTGFSVDVKGDKVIVTPDELITAFSTRLKKYTEGYWDCPVKTAVLSVPTRLSEANRVRFVTAVEKAGFDILGTIAEPCAAVLSFHYDNPSADRKKLARQQTPFASPSQQNETILVVDVGTEAMRTNIVLANQGLLHMAGETVQETKCSANAIDNLVFDFFAKEFTKENEGLDLNESARAVIRLKQACEQVKRTLSASPRASVQLDGLYQGYDLFADISRAKFDVLCDPIFTAFSSHLEQTFAQFNGKITPSHITSVVLAGGSTSLTRFTTLIDTFFRKYNVSPTIQRHVNICDSIAFGAAKQASILSLHQTKQHDKDIATQTAQQEVITTTTGQAAPETSLSLTSTINSSIYQTYKTTPVTLGKNLYIKTFYNTFNLAVPSTTSPSTTVHSTYVINKPFPDTVTPTFALYESSIANACDVSTENAQEIVTMKLDRNAIISAFGTNPDYITPVTIVFRLTFDKQMQLVIDVAYHSKSSPTLTWTSLVTQSLIKEGTQLTTQSIQEYNTMLYTTSIDNRDVLDYTRLVAKIQMMSEHYSTWKSTPKHQRFITRNAFMTPFITKADDSMRKLQSFIDLPNPYVTGQDITPYTMKDLTTIATYTEAEALFDQFGQAIADVLHYRKYTAAEAQAEFNKKKNSSNSNPVTHDDDDDLDIDLDSDDMDLDLGDIDLDDDDDNDDDNSGDLDLDLDLDMDLGMSDASDNDDSDDLDLDIGGLDLD